MRSGRWSNDFNLAFKWWHFAATFLCTSLSALSVLHIFPGRSTTKTLPHTFPPQDQMSFKAETLLLSFTVAHFLRPRTLSGILIDHVFVSIHRGQIHHSNLSSCWCAELIMCRRGRGEKKEDNLLFRLIWGFPTSPRLQTSSQSFTGLRELLGTMGN